MKKGLLIHSYGGKLNWEHTVWGYPPDRPGRLVTGMKIILEEEIDVVLICGSAGEWDGKKECWWMQDRLYQGLPELINFSVFPIFQKYSVSRMKEILDRVLVIKEKNTAANTAGEAEFAGKFFAAQGVEKLFIMSSLDHVSRCIRDDLADWLAKYPALAANVYAAPSMTFYSERTPQDKEISKMENVVIIEPPFYELVGSRAQKIFKLRSNLEAIKDLDAVFDKYGA